MCFIACTQVQKYTDTKYIVKVMNKTTIKAEISTKFKLKQIQKQNLVEGNVGNFNKVSDI